MCQLQKCRIYAVFKDFSVNTALSQKSDRRDSNPRFPPWQGGALPTEPLSHLRTSQIILDHSQNVNLILFHFSPHFCARSLRITSLCQVRADTNLAMEKFYFSIFSYRNGCQPVSKGGLSSPFVRYSLSSRSPAAAPMEMVCTPAPSSIRATGTHL